MRFFVFIQRAFFYLIHLFAEAMSSGRKKRKNNDGFGDRPKVSSRSKSRANQQATVTAALHIASLNWAIQESVINASRELKVVNDMVLLFALLVNWPGNPESLVEANDPQGEVRQQMMKLGLDPVIFKNENSMDYLTLLMFRISRGQRLIEEKVAEALEKAYKMYRWNRLAASQPLADHTFVGITPPLEPLICTPPDFSTIPPPHFPAFFSRPPPASSSVLSAPESIPPTQLPPRRAPLTKASQAEGLKGQDYGTPKPSDLSDNPELHIHLDEEVLETR